MEKRPVSVFFAQFFSSVLVVFVSSGPCKQLSLSWCVCASGPQDVLSPALSASHGKVAAKRNVSPWWRVLSTTLRVMDALVGERDYFLNIATLFTCFTFSPLSKPGARNASFFFSVASIPSGAGDPFLPTNTKPRTCSLHERTWWKLSALGKQLRQTVLHHFRKECLDKWKRVDFLPAWTSHWSLRKSRARGVKQRTGSH